MKTIRKYLGFVAFLIFVTSMTTVFAKEEEPQSVTNDRIAKVDNYINDTSEQVKKTDFAGLWAYISKLPPLSQFFDANGNLNVIYDNEKTLTIVKFNSEYKINSSYSIEKPLPVFGAAICDVTGNYYVVYGKNDEEDIGDVEVIRVVKYSNDFSVSEFVTYKGTETCPYEGLTWGTKIPFSDGNCSLAFNGNVLACSYARKMYSGHQSNHVIYVNCDTMQKVNMAPSYTSHSFDQRIIVTSDGNYLTADLGDAYDRGFNITRIQNWNTDIWDNHTCVPFHFREGSNRDYGYNETYAQLGGIGELSTGYVLSGTSEKTLSQDTAPTYRSFCGDSEARNVFIQIFRKDFWNYSSDACQLLDTPDREVVGQEPSDALTKLWLSGNEVDYGVLWLTDYPKEYCAVNPKLIVTKDDHIVLLWEKYKYETQDAQEQYIGTYYMILDSSGSILQEATQIKDIRLTDNEDLLCKDNCILWCTSDGTSNNLIVHQMYLGETMQVKDITTSNVSSIPTQKFTDEEVKPEVVVKDNETILCPGLDYVIEYENNVSPGKACVKVKGLGQYTGSKMIYFNIAPASIYIEELFSDEKGSIYIYTDTESWQNYNGIQIEYALDSKLTNMKKKTVASSEAYIYKLKSKKTYYVRVRPYNLIDGKKVYGDYTGVKKVKVE